MISAERIAPSRADGRQLCSAAFILFFAAVGRAQVLPPQQIRDPQLRVLERQYLPELRMIPVALKAHDFPYPFYFSRKLDLEEKDQKRSDQHAIGFDRYEKHVVVKITGNYFVNYPAESSMPEERARQTYETVMLPLLEAAARAFKNSDVPQAFELEISHRVERKIAGAPSESVENVLLILPKASAERLAAASDPQARQAAVLEGQAFLNAAPISFWPQPGEELAQDNPPDAEEPAIPAEPATPAAVPTTPPAPTVSASLLGDLDSNPLANFAKPRLEQAPAARDLSPDAIKRLQTLYEPNLVRLVRELGPPAHLAAPTFIPLHNGVYLWLQLSTQIPGGQARTQDQFAALAFDEGVATLIRPVLACFNDRDDFDGIDFSATVRLAGPSGTGKPAQVEFIFPLNALRAYRDSQMSGQQLIDAGAVLINGQRVNLSLQAAETAPAGH